MTDARRRPHNVRPVVDHSPVLLTAYAAVLAAALVVLVLDQVSKQVVSQSLRGGRVVDFLGGAVRLDFTSNTGAAFGLFKNAGLLFVFIALAVTVAFVAYRRRLAALPMSARLASGMVLGGALGNALDRVRLGYVVDFIDLRWWPVFNLADSCIVIGACLLALHSLGGPGVQERA